MMMIPRSYVHTPPKRARSTDISEKGSVRSTRSRSNSPSTTSPISFSLFRSRETSPTKTVTRSSSLQPKVERKEQERTPPRPQPKPLPVQDVPRFRRGSAKDMLSATAIPIRRKPRGRLSQRLPQGDHVADFSKLLMDDTKLYPVGSVPKSLSHANLDALFGNMDEVLEEGQMYIGSEGLDSMVLRARSVSNDSFASMPSPDECNASETNSQHSSTSPVVPERKLRHLITSEDCTTDHPLSPLEESDDSVDTDSVHPITSPTIRKLAGQSGRKRRISIKSSLTAPLKALKSAAQSVSPMTHFSMAGAGDMVAHSFFDIQPFLTDDRRPPPSLDEPSPELRRYLNPPPLDSAAQLHFWQDHRQAAMTPSKGSAKKRNLKARKVSVPRTANNPHPSTRDLPPVVQMADCLPPSVRTEHASSPPIWLSSDGNPVNKMTATPLLFDPYANGGKGDVNSRRREPRENSNFLRVFVCEMQMRRNGKLTEDLSAGRARLWLPPVTSNVKEQPGKPPNLEIHGATKTLKRSASDRLGCLSIEDI